MNVIYRLLRFSKKYWVYFFIAIICLLAGIAFNLVIPEIVSSAIDNALSQGDYRYLVYLAIGILGASILRGAAAYGQQYFGEVASQKVAYDVRNAMFNHLQRLSFSYHDKAQTGQLMSRATADVEAVRMLIARGILTTLHLIILITSISVILLLKNWQLGLITLAFVPVIMIRGRLVARIMQPIWLAIQQLVAELGTILEENLVGIRAIRAYLQHKRESGRFAAGANKLYNEQSRVIRIRALNTPLFSMLITLPVGLILWYGGRQVMVDNLTIGQVTAFMFYFGIMAMPVRQLGIIVGMASRAVSAGSRIFEVLDTDPDIVNKRHALVLDRPAGSVRFTNVSFSYDESVPALRNINFVANPGDMVALVGTSGSGKTTIASLIPRFYDVIDGAITIDDIDIRDVDVKSLRKSIGIVQQDIFIFAATIRENLVYGAVNATLEQVEAAARAAHLHDFIESLPAGYDTWVGERGITLSGGEKQRLSIARTVLTNPPIMIFDDSTSSVDVETERFIYDAIRDLSRDRTTFIITNRLSLIRNADIILVLDKGNLVASGKHSELLETSDIYRQIHQLQSDESVNLDNIGNGD